MGIKQFSFFRKLVTDSETSTEIGGILTLLAFIIAGLLVFHETKLFLTPEVSYQAVIDNDTQQNINIQIDITVKAPCIVLSLDQQDDVGVHRLDVQDTLMKIRQKSNGETIAERWGVGVSGYEQSQQQLDDTKKAIADQEQCRFTGFVKVNKVPGNFHISYHAAHALMQRLFQIDFDSYKKLKLDHSIHTLQFGNEETPAQTLKKFPPDFQSYIPNFKPIQKSSSINAKSDYEYFINALPSRFYNNEINNYHTVYKFSMTQGEAPKSLSEMDAIYFRYQFNPVNMIYQVKQRKFYHYLVQLCAIIGGVFAVIGLLNSLLQKLN